MALLDSMESVLDYLKETLQEEKNSQETPTSEDGDSKLQGYRTYLADYKADILAHIEAQKSSAVASLPVVSSKDLAKIRTKMDTLHNKLNTLKEELKDLEP